MQKISSNSFTNKDNYKLFNHTHTLIYIYILGGAYCVMVIVAGNGLGDTSSNPGPDWLHFT